MLFYVKSVTTRINYEKLYLFTGIVMTEIFRQMLSSTTYMIRVRTFFFVLRHKYLFPDLSVCVFIIGTNRDL